MQSLETVFQISDRDYFHRAGVALPYPKFHEKSVIAFNQKRPRGKYHLNCISMADISSHLQDPKNNRHFFMDMHHPENYLQKRGDKEALMC